MTERDVRLTDEQRAASLARLTAKDPLLAMMRRMLDAGFTRDDIAHVMLDPIPDRQEISPEDRMERVLSAITHAAQGITEGWAREMEYLPSVDDFPVDVWRARLANSHLHIAIKYLMGDYDYQKGQP